MAVTYTPASMTELQAFAAARGISVNQLPGTNSLVTFSCLPGHVFRIVSSSADAIACGGMLLLGQDTATTPLWHALGACGGSMSLLDASFGNVYAPVLVFNDLPNITYYNYNYRAIQVTPSGVQAKNAFTSTGTVYFLGWWCFADDGWIWDNLDYKTAGIGSPPDSLLVAITAASTPVGMDGAFLGPVTSDLVSSGNKNPLLAPYVPGAVQSNFPQPGTPTKWMQGILAQSENSGLKLGATSFRAFNLTFYNPTTGPGVILSNAPGTDLQQALWSMDPVAATNVSGYIFPIGYKYATYGQSQQPGGEQWVNSSDLPSTVDGQAAGTALGLHFPVGYQCGLFQSGNDVAFGSALGSYISTNQPLPTLDQSNIRQPPGGSTNVGFHSANVQPFYSAQNQPEGYTTLPNVLRDPLAGWEPWGSGLFSHIKTLTNNTEATVRGQALANAL